MGRRWLSGGEQVDGPQPVPVGGQVVTAAGEELGGDGGADEAGGAGDEDAAGGGHGVLLRELD